jgi:hypothetical protein
MKEFKVKTNTHIVIKREDVLTLITSDEAVQLANIMQKIEDERFKLGKEIRQAYYVVNHKEPYSQKVFEVIKEGELEKEESLFDKDPRFCKVCECTQDHACAGGCYWVTDDLCSACVYGIFSCEAIVTPENSIEPIDGTSDYLADEITSEEICEGYIAGHAAALGLSSEAEDTAVRPGDKVRIYAVYQRGESIKQIMYLLEPKKE